MARMNLVQRHADHHGGTRPLSDLTAIVLHETEGFNGGDYATLKAGGPRNVSVHFWVPDYDDPGAEAWRTPDGGTVVQFLPLEVAGNSVGTAKPGFGNAQTVSIELGNYNSEAYGELQLEMLDQLIADIDGKVGRPLPIVSHAEIALPAGRKTDPGRTFPLAAYKAYRLHDSIAAPPVTPPKPPAKPMPLLHKGDIGGTVRTLQRELNAHAGARLIVDGVFGGRTLAAVRAFQAKKKLSVDGVVGKHTWSALGY